MIEVNEEEEDNIPLSELVKRIGDKDVYTDDFVTFDNALPTENDDQNFEVQIVENHRQSFAAESNESTAYSDDDGNIEIVSNLPSYAECLKYVDILQKFARAKMPSITNALFHY